MLDLKPQHACKCVCVQLSAALTSSVAVSLSPLRRWVDDCHAAVVCSDPRAALQLLAAATAAGPAAEFRLRGYADAGSGTHKLPPSGGLGGLRLCVCAGGSCSVASVASCRPQVGLRWVLHWRGM